MSTKVTIAYASRDLHGEDFHLYYDHADMQVHLEIDGREIPLPSRLQGWIYNMSALYESLQSIKRHLEDEDLLYLPPLGAIRAPDQEKKYADLLREARRNRKDPLDGLDIPMVEW